MADTNYTEAQLAKIVAPNLNAVDYASSLENVFENINNNFKKLASMPFIQGVQGDSYTLTSKPILKITNTVSQLTKEGALLLNGIFNTSLFKENDGLNDINSILSSLEIYDPDVISTITDGSNNLLYFYNIIDDAGNTLGQALGQMYFFVDGRLKKLGKIYSDNPGSLTGFNDYSGFYNYIPETKEGNEKFELVQIAPSLYYDETQKIICWKFNGEKTGIPAIGAKGIDGNDANLFLVKAEPIAQDGAPITGTVTGVFNYYGKNDTMDKAWSEDFSVLKNGNALICIEVKDEGGKVKNRSFAFGMIKKQSENQWNAMWDASTVITDFMTDIKITDFLDRIGYFSSPSSLIGLYIPACPNRSVYINNYIHTMSTSYSGGGNDSEPTDFLFRMLERSKDLGNSSGSSINAEWVRMKKNEEEDYKNILIDNYNLLIQRHNIEGVVSTSSNDKKATLGTPALDYVKIKPNEIVVGQSEKPDPTRVSSSKIYGKSMVCKELKTDKVKENLFFDEQVNLHKIGFYASAGRFDGKSIQIASPDVYITGGSRKKEELDEPTNKGNLHVYGEVTGYVNNQSEVLLGVPIGTVVAWIGETAPEGWLMCNGATIAASTYPILYNLLPKGSIKGVKNLPDLRGKFILGVSTGRTNYPNHALFSSDGSETKTISINNMPSHNHNITHNLQWNTSERGESTRTYQQSANKGASQSSMTITCGSAGGNEPLNIMPPYYALNFIIKAR